MRNSVKYNTDIKNIVYTTSALRKPAGVLFLCLILTLLTGCNGPSDEKIAEAQSTYAALIDLHNQVVDAHQTIMSGSLDDELTALSEKVGQIDDFNLNEMPEEDIDLLIESMNDMMTSYEEYLQNIEDIRKQEEAAVLIQLPLTLSNKTGFTFTGVFLYEKGDTSHKNNILENLGDFEPEQTLTGLMIYRDVDNTPWILELEDTESSYTLELPVSTYDSTGKSLMLTYDSESAEIKYS